MILIGQTVSQYDDLECVLCEPRGQQRRIFDDRIVLAVAQTGMEGFERVTPVILNAPLCLVAYGADGKINRSVDQADSCASISTGTLETQVEQPWTDAGQDFPA
jgi:hypothetical protein